MVSKNVLKLRMQQYFPDESATFKTLNDLKKRGVKVDLGFPDEMWDTPDAEVVRLKTKVHKRCKISIFCTNKDHFTVLLTFEYI